ncbi:hypothetical protein [Rhodovarius lipocyclicus]|uniref:hypothetical protein n=1 Tax=Rhodovarius lipocyclicus TaxID=268410 RepID=UPI00135695B2|nr:hypothetical protein [Rhodovarius lipocyclicus]
MITRWEWMAAFDTNGTTCISFRTDKLSDRTDPDQEMQDHWANGGSVIIHHNHPSDESLSCADWNALLKFSVSEIFAHTSDGSCFYGKILNPTTTSAALVNFDAAGNAGEGVLIAARLGHPQALGHCAGLLRKHVVAEALSSKGHVDYQFSPGPIWQSVLSPWAQTLPLAIQAAANEL